MNELVAIEKIAQWEKLKTLVLDSVSSPITKRVYNMALNEFMAWFQQMPRPGFTKATVSAWRVSLEERRLGSSSIIIRMSCDSQAGGGGGGQRAAGAGTRPGDKPGEKREIDRDSRRELAVAKTGAGAFERARYHDGSRTAGSSDSRRASRVRSPTVGSCSADIRARPAT